MNTSISSIPITVKTNIIALFIGNDIPPIPSGVYDYDQLGQSTNENTNTDNQHHYDPLASM